MPGPAPSVYSPFIIWGMPIANSTTSTPRRISPLASGMVLPCSRAKRSASASLSRCASSRNFIITRARRCGLVAAHSGCAARAFSTAARNSALEASATWAWTSPVIGSKTSANRPDVPATSRPPMKCPILRMRSSKKSECRFWQHLAGFRVFGKVFSAHEECAKTTVWAVAGHHTTNVECGNFASGRGGCLLGRFFRNRTGATKHGVAARLEYFVGKLTGAGNAGHHQRPHHGGERRQRLFPRRPARHAIKLVSEHVDHLLHPPRKYPPRLCALSGNLRRQRRHRTAVAGIVAVNGCKIGIHDLRQALFDRRLFRQFSPFRGRAVHRMREGLDHQGITRIEMRIKPAMGQAGILHEIGDTDAVSSLFAELDRRLLHNSCVSLELVFFGIPHRNPMICFKSYNDGNILLTSADAKCCILFGTTVSILASCLFEKAHPTARRSRLSRS